MESCALIVALLLSFAQSARIARTKSDLEHVLRAASSGSAPQCPRDFDPLWRRDCNGFLGNPGSKDSDENVRKETCTGAGCCWQPLKEVPWCYAQPDSSGTCSTHHDPAQRRDCGASYHDMHESKDWREEVRGEACHKAGCCWQPLKHVPWCFPEPKLPSDYCTCPALEPEKRTDCAIFHGKNESKHSDDGVRERACLTVGCCWSPLAHGSTEPWCFVNPDCSEGDCDKKKNYAHGPKGGCTVRDPNGRFKSHADAVCCRQAGAKKVVEKVTISKRISKDAEAAIVVADQEATEAKQADKPAADAKEEAQKQRQKAKEATDEVAKQQAAQAAAEAAAAALDAEREREEAALRAAHAATVARKKAEEAAAAKKAEEAAKAAGKAAADVVVKEHDGDEDGAKEAAEDAGAKTTACDDLEDEQKKTAALEVTSKTAPGTLKVNLVSAHNLPNSDPFWTFGVKPDAFANVNVGGDQKGTHRVNNTGNPHWNWQGVFAVGSHVSTVTMDVYDYDLLGDDDILWGLLDNHDYLGGVRVNFRDIEPNKPTSFATAIGRKGASIEYTLTWAPNV